MSIKAEEFDDLRAWCALMIELAIPLPPGLPLEAHPITLLDAMANKAPSRARQGLAMAIGDLVEATAHLAPADIANVDAHFSKANLPTLSTIRLRFQRQINGILRRGAVRNEVEYHALRNVAESAIDEGDQRRLWALLDAYKGERTERRT
ncbi:hypothetical protein [Bosea psychrotolerans]|uniref:hypothetical protein n=1 Tax=Bosea psychrotolerans TaxID=1871628 RepID=UPI000CDAEE09|nr:hypothetical protein [Bosea psychrotolerans]